MTSLQIEKSDRKVDREEIVTFLKGLRDRIIAEFEELERQESSCKFSRTCWDHRQGGGGEISVLRGTVFEKAAVNWSGVHGDSLPNAGSSRIRESVPFFATGVSLITHMANPHMPTVHMNIRYIETGDRFWFGGGYDLTPMGYPYQEDTEHFHGVARAVLGDELYEKFSANAKEYFTIPHRKKERGVGGIFFDDWNSGDLENDMKMWRGVGETFLEAIVPIYKKRIGTDYGHDEREKQLEIRGHYAEFNLAIDRGTKFGFQSGGNTEAILCSMPPIAKW
jgi:coproporphyrinogen III oxidase